MNTVVSHSSLQSYFCKSLHSALLNQNVHASDHTVIYLSSLLENFARSDNLFDYTEDGPRIKPLALYYADAVSAENKHQRTQALRKLGDVALFISGIFSQSLATKVVDIDYYVAMGGSAYSYLHDEFEHIDCQHAFSIIYYELSSRFVQFTDVLAEISQGSQNRDADLLRQYEIWIKTNSPLAREKLLKQGFDPAAFDRSTVQH